MKVDFYSTASIPSSIKRDISRIFRKVVNNESLVEGLSCRVFEEEFAAYLRLSHVIGVGNGFDALRIGLEALGIKKGDRVAVPAHTFIATWFAVLAIGAIPVGVDVTQNGQINLDELEMENELKAVIPVHMHGMHCDMRRLTEWAKKKKIKVLEDCAQSAGLEIQGKMAGAWGDAAAFSFYPTKNLFSFGDGGAIATNDPKVKENARLLSRYGSQQDDKYTHNQLGFNSRLDTIQAAFLSYELKLLDSWNEQRQEIASTYSQALKEILVKPIPGGSSVFHHVPVLLDERERVRNFLSKNGVSTEIHYPKVAGIEADPESRKSYSVSMDLSRRILSLPISPWQTKKETRYCIEQVINALSQ